jgi:uncharacterized protein (DUF1697 family)
MKKFAAFIRGINVGGITLKMEDIKGIFVGLGFNNVITYIQSGNIVFDSSETDKALLEERIRESIATKSNLDVAVFVKTKEQIQSLVSNNPFGKTMDEKRSYVTMLDSVPAGGKLDAIKAINSAKEKFILKKDVVYSYYGNGYGKSKYTNNYFEKVFGVSATTRNWTTINKILDIMNAG